MSRFMGIPNKVDGECTIYVLYILFKKSTIRKIVCPSTFLKIIIYNIICNITTL